MPTRHPNVLWAQRRDHVYLTIDLQDVKDPDIKLGSDGAGHGTVTFRGTGEGADPEAHAFQLDLVLCRDIDPAASKIATTARHIVLALAKKSADGEEGGGGDDEKKKSGGEEEESAYWPRLLAAPGKAPPNVKVDWDKWVDEDEDGAAGGIGGDFDFGDYGGGGMGGGMMGGGMGGAGGMDISQLLAGMGGGGAGGGGGFDVGSFPDAGEEDEEEGEEADAPGAAGAAAAEEVTA